MTEKTLTLEEVARLVDKTEWNYCDSELLMGDYHSTNIMLSFHHWKRLFSRKEYVASAEISFGRLILWKYEYNRGEDAEKTQKVQELYERALNKYKSRQQKITELQEILLEELLQKIRSEDEK